MQFSIKILISVALTVALIVCIVGMTHFMSYSSKDATRVPSSKLLRNVAERSEETKDTRFVKLKRKRAHSLEKVMEYQVYEGIDEKLKQSDLHPFGIHRKDTGPEKYPSLTNVTIGQIVGSKKRLLADKNVLSLPGIIGLDQQASTTAETYAYRYIFNNLKEYSTQFVLYPFTFTYTPDLADTSKDVLFDKGGVFTLKPEALPTDNTQYNYFRSLKATTDVSFGRAKALYDVNIAVLRIEDYYDDVYKEITYESSSFCNLLSTYLGKYSDCMAGSKDYYAFKNDSKNAGKTALVMISADDIATFNLLVTPDGAPRFQLFIVPDYYTGAHTLITTKLGTKGVANIKNFLNKGGLVYTTGKGGYLLENWGILTKGLYNTNTLMSSAKSDLSEELIGCETTETDFMKRLMCFNLANSGNSPSSYILSAYQINNDKTTGMTIINSFNGASTTLKKKDLMGLPSDLTVTEKSQVPFTLYTQYGKGKIILMNGNPLYKSAYNKVFYNMLLLAMSKNIVYDAYVGSKDNKPIPGGEAGIQLDVKLTFMNLFDTNVNDMALHIWFPKGLIANDIPATCTLDSTNMTLLLDLTAVNASSHIKCSQSLLGQFEKFEALMNVEIVDSSATQQKYDILMATSYVSYTESETGVTYAYEVGAIRTNAQLAALLRGALNPDPSSFYPIRGRGQYVDNVLQVENKEDTDAEEVEYIGLVPLISPVVDGSDQTAVIRLARFLPSYYNQPGNLYYYPFQNVEGKNYDFIDYMWLNGKDVVLDSEWDIPVKQGKFMRNDTFPTVAETGPFDILNLNMSTKIDNKNIVLKQVYYANADKFFEHATQRLMVFVDTAKENGAKTLYPSGIPDNEKNPNRPNVAKKELAWSRSDLYFYSAADYQQPKNINYTHVISVDRYPKFNGTCVSVFGNAKAKIEVPGFFTIDQTAGLKANEYSNELLMYCEKKKVWLDEVASLSNGSIKPIHYLVRVTDSDISRADDIMGFVASTDGSGYMENYPELKFIYGHYFNAFVDGSISRQGGRLEITLPDGIGFLNEDTVDPIKNYFVSFSADQVAFYKTTFDPATRVITGFFKRGLMPNEAYGKTSLLGIMVEQLNSSADITLTMRAFEMKYDISAVSLNFERYTLRETRQVTLLRDKFFSLPAAEIRVKMNRTNNDTSIYPYELLEPYTRFGVYIQELIGHRTIWGSAESHHVTDPGVQSISPGFALISNLGISSVPFAEYVTTGKALLIPSSPSTSRLEWKDLWGRQWSQPLRSVFPDVPPIPPPLRNFMMTTTFELFKAGTTTRVLEWTSDESLDIRVQLKLLNNYPKYFQITTCKDNEVSFFHTKETMFEYDRIFENPPYSYQTTTTNAPTNSYQINFGHRSAYGMCFDQEGTVLKATNVSAADRAAISTAYLCASNLDAQKMLECNQQLAGLPTVSKRAPGNTATLWNYSPKVEKYYPKNYIKPIMWDLTHYDYDDNSMDKAYKYHMDNSLPGMDFGPSWNPPFLKPHNLIAQPIFKGFGFTITYDKTKTLKKFPKYKGWWSDNLQNKDHTLLAGQAVSNDVSVDKDTLLPDPAWINAKDLINPITRDAINKRLKNIHTCLFNQNRVRLSVNQEVNAYLGNVYQNNIIPILPDLNKDDPRLTTFDCSGIYQYTPYNISQLNNVVSTPTGRDWLYFAANLRGNALEDINIPFTLAPFSGVKYEGFAKVQDGGRFVYWNPANGPNSFLIVDNPVNVVQATRSDLSIACEVIPKSTTTFKPVLYHVITVSDPAEINREWKYEIYTNNYGFGDSTVAIYVGGAQSTKATVNPGESTLAKITFYNNAGFDWNMLGKAIEFNYIGSTPINANDLLYSLKHSIQAPTKYNFMVPIIPDEIKDYITIVPSDHNIDVAPQFFDFMNINVVTIRDGFKGDYYYKITVNSDFPESLTGKVYEIKLEVNETYFDKLPGYKDPTGAFHDYKLKIPSIKFGVPYTSGPYQGKTFYTSGYSTNLYITCKLPSSWVIENAREVTTIELEAFRAAAGFPDEYNEKLLVEWNKLMVKPAVPFTNVTSGTNNLVSFDMSKAYPTFPKKNGANPDIASFKIMIKVNNTQLPYGTVTVLSSPKVYYTDLSGKNKTEVIAAPLDKTVSSKGAWLQVYYTSTIVQEDGAGGYKITADQRWFTSDVQAIFKVQFTTKNVGTDVAYRVNFTVTLAQGITIIESMMRFGMGFVLTQVGPEGVLEMQTNQKIAPGDFYSEVIYLKFEKPVSRRLLASTTSLTVIKSVGAAMTLLDSQAASAVAQAISTPLTFSVITNDRDSVSLFVAGEFVNGNPLFHLRANPVPTTTTSGKTVRCLFYREILSLDCDDDVNSPSTGSCSSIVRTQTVIQALSSNYAIDNQPIPTGFTGYVRSGRYKFKVETYDDKKLLLSSATWEAVAERAPEKPNTNTNNQQNVNNNPSEIPNGTPNGPNNQNNNRSNLPNDTSLAEANSVGGYSLPIWAIALIPSCAFVVILVAAILIYRKYRMVKVHVEPTSQEVPIPTRQDGLPENRQNSMEAVPV